MFKSIFHLSLIYITLAPLARGQLHLLAGSPHEKYNETYAAGLFRVEDDGAVKLVSDLVPKLPGAYWINISYDLRKAVIETGYPEDAIIVVDFDAARIVKKCKRTEEPSGRRGYGEQWLSSPPAYGPSFEWVATSADPRDVVGRGMLLDPAVSCEESFTNRPIEGVRYALKNGDAGPGDVVFNMGLNIVIADTRDKLDYGRVYAKRVALNYTVPRALLLSTRWFPRLAISDSQVFCISLVPREPGTEKSYLVLVFRKRDKTWHVLETTSEVVPGLRGFGKYIAVTERSLLSSKNPRSAGGEEWKKGIRRMGPDLKKRMDDPEAGVVFPGKFQIYDVETEKLFPLTTDQADSEVLLVESGVVYYRVLNRLYEAPISNQGIGPARLLATDDAILDAHWAFMKH